MEHSFFFRYKAGNTIFHKMHPSLKIILMVVLAIVAFFCPPFVAIFLYLSIMAYSYIFIGLSLKEILGDAKPMIVYAILLYAASCVLHSVYFFARIKETSSFSIKDVANIFIIESSYCTLLFRMALSLSITSIFYRTTGTAGFAYGFRVIEQAITRKDETPFSDMLSLCITFVPRIATFWKRIDTAWLARGGKQNIKKIISLTPILFRLSMREAWEKSLARENRT